jgi:hypothetical protein
MSTSTDHRIAARLDIEVEKGRTLYRVYHCQDYDSGNTIQDFVFTNYSGASMQVRRKPHTSLTELTFSTDDNSIELGNEGRLTLNASADVMDGIRAGTYEYDLYLHGTDAIYAKRPLFFGKFIVANKITS